MQERATATTVLAATDFSAAARAAVERAARLAREHEARLLLVHAFDELAWKNLRSLLAIRKRPLAGHPLQRAWNAVRAEAARVARVHGIACDAAVELGSAARTIAAKASKARAALIVLGPHGRRVGDRIYLGSTALGVARLAPCPVLVARRRPQAPLRRCLAGVDFSPASIRAAQAAAGFFPDADITLLHAVQPIAAPLVRTAGLRAALRAEADARLARAFAPGQPGRLDSAARLTAVGPAQLALRRALARGRFDLVALGRDSKPALLERVLGSVPADVLQHARADVLIAP